MFKHVKMACVILCTLSVFMFVVLPVAADDKPAEVTPTKNSAIEIHPDLGTTEPGGVVGKNGYKVFHPGAIAEVTVTALQAPAAVRRGFTDAWLAWSWDWDWKKWGWDHRATHESTSDLWEEEIWVDGTLKVTTDTSPRELCTQHTTGNRAVCNTKFFQIIPRTIRGDSFHHFKKAGYADSNFNTGDNA